MTTNLRKTLEQEQELVRNSAEETYQDLNFPTRQ